MSFDLDAWLPDPMLTVTHRREASAPPAKLWSAAAALRLADTGLLGRLIRWRIPGTSSELAFDAMFREPPFIVLEQREDGLLSGLVGRIWTLRRDYPELSSPAEFTEWSAGGTAKVLFATWVEPLRDERAALRSEVRLTAFGVQGRVGLGAVRPLISGFHHLVGSEGIAAAVRLAERSSGASRPSAAQRRSA